MPKLFKRSKPAPHCPSNNEDPRAITRRSGWPKSLVASLTRNKHPGQASQIVDGEPQNIAEENISPRPEIVTVEDVSGLLPAAAEVQNGAANIALAASGSTVKKSGRSSRWKLAEKRLEESNPDLFKKLHQIQQILNDDAFHVDKLLETVSSRGKSLKDEQSRTSSSLVEQTIKHILLFKDPAMAAAKFDPTKASELALRGFFVVLEATLAETTLNQKMIRDIGEVASKLAKWAVIEAIYLPTLESETPPKQKAIEAGVIQLYCHVLKWVASTLRRPDDKLSRIFRVYYDTGVWEESIKNINSSHEICETHLSTMKEKSTKHIEVLNWISDVDHRASYKGLSEKTGVDDRYKNCGEWLLENPEFTAWSSNNISERDSVLWLCGTVGTGKTTLVTRVIRWHLKNWWKYTTRRFGYVFCSRGQDLSDRSEYHAILKQLLRQASSNPFTGDVSQIVIDHYKKEGRDFGKPPPLLVRETEQLLIDVLNASDLVFRVMIDALDECDHPEKLLGILESVSNATTGTLELLVSSRPDVEVVDEFSNCIKIDLNTAASKSDMLTFITREVENKEKRKRLLKGKRPDLEKRLISILERRAGGMFRWVQLQLSLFLDQRQRLLHSSAVEEMLEKLDSSSIAGVKELNLAYAEIFEQNTSSSKIQRKHAAKVYRILLSSKKRLHIDAIAEAVAFDCGDDPFDTGNITHHPEVKAQYILELCRNFIVVVKYSEDQEFADFAHISVKDYLQGEGEGSLSGGEYLMPECIIEAAKTCLNYMVGCEVGCRQVLPYRGQLRLDVFIHREHFIRYAGEFWGDHCADLTVEQRQEHGISGILSKWMISGRGLITFEQYLGALRSFKSQWESLSLLSDSKSPLFAACKWNLVEVAKECLLRNADPALLEERNKYEWTPLYLACKMGRKEMVAFLLENYEPQVEAIGVVGNSALHECYDIDIAKILIGKHPQLVHCEDKYGQTPLFSVITTHATDLQLARLYLDSKANVNHPDNEEDTPLHYAAHYGDADTVELLVSRCATIEARDKLGRTPLLLALTFDNGNAAISISAYLMNHGALLDAKDHKCRGAIYHAESREAVDYVISELLLTSEVSRNDILDARDTENNTALMLAAKRKSMTKLCYMIDIGADATVHNDAGQTALHLLMDLNEQRASFREREIFKVVQLVVEQGCNVFERDSSGQQPIHKIFPHNDEMDGIWYHFYIQAEWFLASIIKEGADVTCTDDTGNTVVDYLLKLLRKYQPSDPSAYGALLEIVACIEQALASRPEAIPKAVSDSMSEINKYCSESKFALPKVQ